MELTKEQEIAGINMSQLNAAYCCSRAAPRLASTLSHGACRRAAGLPCPNPCSTPARVSIIQSPHHLRGFDAMRAECVDQAQPQTQSHLGKRAAQALGTACKVTPEHFARVEACCAAHITLPSAPELRIAECAVRTALLITAAVSTLTLPPSSVAVNLGPAQHVSGCDQESKHASKQKGAQHDHSAEDSRVAAVVL
jgi:hypothetical protein